MQLTEQHRQIRDTLARFIDDEINPQVDAWEEEGQLPSRQLFKQLGDLGLLGVTKPEENGGLGLDWSYGAVVAETLGRIHCGGVPMAIGVQTDMATPALARFGSAELRAEFLTPAVAGEAVVCIGVSETGAGSDVAAIRTTARRDGDDYVVNGGKMWITNGCEADFMCLLANTSDDHPHRNKSLIMVPLRDENGQHRKGVTVARKLDKLGMRCSDTAEFFFDDLRVPRRNLIGEEGRGFVYQMKQFQEERLWGALSTLEAMDGIIDETIAYTSERRAFGQSILDNQVVHFRLAELRTEVEAVRALAWRGVEAMVAGEDVTRLATMAKLKASRLTREVNDGCLQYWGGMGYMSETRVSRAYRDGRICSIAAGADEVMLSILCKLEGTLPGRNNRA